MVDTLSPEGVKAEIRRMQREAHKEQESELLKNFNQLSLERRAQVVMFSRKLAEDEERERKIERFWDAFCKLNDEGKALALAYVKALAANPKYRKK